MADHTHIPLMYYPTNIAVLDDDPKFLNFMHQAIAYPLPFVSDTDPHKLFKYLRTHTHQPNVLSSHITKVNYDVHTANFDDTNEHFSIDFLSLQGELTQPERYKNINVVFVDQNLKKDITGLEFCQKVREAGLPVKLILLTGQVGLQDAVDAFNNGLINAYLPKAQKSSEKTSLKKAINDAINQFTWQQFVDLTHGLTGFLGHIMKPLFNERFIDVVEELMRHHNIVEFYVLDSNCSLLLFDENGHCKQLICINEEDFNDVYDIAKDSEAPYKVLQAIRDRQQFPITKHRQGYLHLLGDAWEDAMMPVNKISGREWYYTLIDRPDIENFSFERYINSVWPTP